MSTIVIPLEVEHARRRPVPNFPAVGRHDFTVAVAKIPAGIPLDPNPRNQNTNRRVYREVAESLLDDGGLFFLQHGGMLILAVDVEKVDDHHYLLHLEEGRDGIADGGHSYKLFRDIIEGEEAEVPRNQFIDITVFSGTENVPDLSHSDIAGPRNQGMQVQPMSIANQDQRFEWIQDRLKAESYYNEIAWRENENKLFDARDILAFMAAVSPFWVPIDSDHYPMGAYSRKWAVLERYLDHEEEFRPLERILPEILELYDRIRFEARDLWNTGDRRFGALRIAQGRKRGEFVFPFIRETSSDYQMRHSAALPMLGAFRRLVIRKVDSDLAEWDGGFENVLKVWRASAAEMIAIARDTSSTITNMTALGRTRTYWAQLDAVVQKATLAAENLRLQRQIEELTRARQ